MSLLINKHRSPSEQFIRAGLVPQDAKVKGREIVDVKNLRTAQLSS